MEELTAKELISKTGGIDSKMKLREIRRDVQRYLRKAIKLDMHVGDSIIEQKAGMEINLSVYLSGMYEKYQVELSK